MQSARMNRPSESKRTGGAYGHISAEFHHENLALLAGKEDAQAGASSLPGISARQAASVIRRRLQQGYTLAASALRLAVERTTLESRCPSLGRIRPRKSVRTSAVRRECRCQQSEEERRGENAGGSVMAVAATVALT